MTKEERSILLENELFILRDSGELPEIAYHSTLYYLTADPEGPQLSLNSEEQRLLQEAAMARCKEIVLRDLEPANRDLRIYRGPLRSVYNWQRYQKFCGRIDRQPDGAFQADAAQALTSFLAQEIADVGQGKRESSINCCSETLLAFADQLHLNEEALPHGWKELCCSQSAC